MCQHPILQTYNSERGFLFFSEGPIVGTMVSRSYAGHFCPFLFTSFPEVTSQINFLYLFAAQFSWDPGLRSIERRFRVSRQGFVHLFDRFKIGEL